MVDWFTSSKSNEGIDIRGELKLSSNALSKPKPVTNFVAKAMSWVIGFGLLIILFAVLTLSSSLNDAESINVAGSMRMQSYRLVVDLKDNNGMALQHIRDFERSLYGPALRTVDSWGTPPELRDEYHHLILGWKNIKGLVISKESDEAQQLLEPYVDQIDRFVLHLQQFNEKKLRTLAAVGGLCLGGILLSSLIVVRYMRKYVVHPLRLLMKASEEVKFGSFDIKIESDFPNELGILAQTFNSMASELGKLYRGLELAVDEKTRRLRQANQSLQVLYQSSQELSSSRIKLENFQAIVHHFSTIEGIVSVEMEIADAGVDGIKLHDGSECDSFPNEMELSVDGETLGKLRWKEGLPCPDRSLINSFGRVLSRGIYYNRYQKQQEQLMLLEERATIARELHDSLAQSLSYLKIQMTLLKRVMASIDDPGVQDKTGVVIADIDTGLSNAYKQLRELLTTFRLTLKETNFGQALKEMADQLDSQTGAEIVLVNQLSSLDIDAHQQVHLLQLLREATINAIKHARADRIVIYCEEKDGKVIAYVKDDGIGFEEAVSQKNHYGMNIMHERAQRLGGELTIESKPNEGCKVTLTYQLEKENTLD